MDTATANATVTAAPTGQTTGRTTEQATDIKPLPVWFFVFEGALSASFDLFKANPHALVVLAVLGAVNLIASLTVLRSRLRLMKGLLRNKGTRKVAIGLIALRFGVHLIMGAIGCQATSAVAHYAFAAAMTATTVTLLWFSQRTALRAVAATRA
ncbi:hypothetical protein [Streptomyces orinoci]|uniref:Uncharacterized protein n=1 Tax=Streptomyces orinoci TaxID=67339 RepID=A0ABV3JQV5_STRON|nr:hypothetical protein [Streptomyces orinoci]